jgi:hypothetical protein
MNNFTLGSESQPRDITFRGHNIEKLRYHVSEIFKSYKPEIPAVNAQSYAKFKIMKFTTTASLILDFPTGD